MVEPIAAVDQVVEHSIGHVQVAAQSDAPLREMSELVRQHGLELRKIYHVDQAQPDQQILLRRNHQIDERRIVDQRRVHLGADHHVPRRRADVFIHPANEREESGMLPLVERDVLAPLHSLPLE